MTSKPLNPTGGKGSVRRNEDNDAYRNNFDNIFRKKTTMMIEDPQERSDEDYERSEDEEFDDTCTWCGGCGEGDYDGAACRKCHGTGVEPYDGVDDDYV
jgi:hypothetical protein